MQSLTQQSAAKSVLTSSSAFRGDRRAIKSKMTTMHRRRSQVVKTEAVQGEVLITVDKPLGVTLKARGGGIPGVCIDRVAGNGAKAGLKSGDVVMYHSSFFGDELWPADQLGFSRSAINACPNQVDFIVVRGPGE